MVTTVRLAFERQLVTAKIASLVAVKPMRANVKESKKYQQILASVRAIGVVEPPSIIPDPAKPGFNMLLDGNLRVEALKDIGASEVECLVALDDEAYSYNKQINRLSATQEHRMIVRAVDRGVPPEKIAEALGLDVNTIRRRFRLLDRICPEAIELLKETTCPMVVFDLLRQMVPMRQIVAAEIMAGQGTFSAAFARTILMATPPDQLVDPVARATKSKSSRTVEHMARLERELVQMQTQVQAVEERYGIDNLQLTLAQAYLKKLLANARLVRWMAARHPDYLEQFQAIAEITTLPSGSLDTETF
jgi:hypothetical protein